VVRFLTDGQNIPFLIAYVVMLAFGLVAVIGGALGHGHGHDHDVDVDVAGHDMDGHLHGDLNHDGDVDFGDTVLGFLGLGKAPVTMLLVSFAWCFGSCGFVTQWIAKSTAENLLPAGVAALIALFPALVLHSFVAKGIGYFTARDDSTAVHSDSFVGKTAIVVIGQTTKGKPTQAKLKDQHGQTHYVLVEPHRDEDILNAGDEVIIVARQGTLFEVMPNDIDLISAHLRVADRPKEQV
jgi:Protein of unknown function (DUF1449)